MKLWIAREKNWQLYGYAEKPVFVDDEWVSMGGIYFLDADLFPEVTFENSPKEVEIKCLNDVS